LSTHVCRLPGSISGSCSASLEPNPDSKIYRTLSSARLRWDRRGNLATTSASLRYWNSARQRYCRQLVRYRKTLASLPTRLPSQQPRPARKAGFSTFENDCGRETDCLLEGDGFEPSVPARRKLLRSDYVGCIRASGKVGATRTTARGHRAPSRDQWFESGFLQRRVLCEPNADEGARDRARLASGLENALGVRRSSMYSALSRPQRLRWQTPRRS
jgi:hypothetical protein